MDLRIYLRPDRDACLTIFDSNTPQYFHPAERSAFARFLQEPKGEYFVMEHEGAIAGCGGYDISDGKIAGLVWGMIRSDIHMQGLGRYLLLFRLREIARVGGIDMVRLETSQHAQLFYEKQGFKVMNVARDGHAPGIDRVEMVMKLKVCV